MISAIGPDLTKNQLIIHCTLTNLDSSCPGSFLKTNTPPSGYPWVSEAWYVTPEPRFRTNKSELSFS